MLVISNRQMQKLDSNAFEKYVDNLCNRLGKLCTTPRLLCIQ